MDILSQIKEFIFHLFSGVDQLKTDSIGVVVLVFLSVALLGYSGINLLYFRHAQHTAEHRRQGRIIVQQSPMEYIVGQADLMWMRLSTAIFFGLVTALLFVSDVPEVIVFILCVVMAILGYFLPWMYFKIKLNLYQSAFENQILLMLSGLISGLRGGMDIQACFFQVAENVPEPMKEALNILTSSVQMNISLPEALEQMYNRFPCEDLRLIITTVKLSLQSGGSMADVLDRQLTIVRKRREVQGKIKSMVHQGTMQAYMISLAPLIFVVVMYFMDPWLTKPLFYTLRGWIFVVSGLVLDIAGFIWLKKIVSINI